MCTRPVWSGFCTFCGAASTFTVAAGPMFSININLREGLLCRSCHLGNRLRLLFKGVEEFCGGDGLRTAQVYMAERITLFFQRVAERVAHLTGSEYLDGSYPPGSTHSLGGVTVRHEDLCGLTFEDESFDVVIHSDVLEHVPDYRRALTEMRRVTRPGGGMFFSVPFLHEAMGHEVRATLTESGELVHHLPPAYHGSPLSTEGSLAFRTYGWALLDELREAGFDQAEIGALTDLNLGFASSNSPSGDYMEPVVFRALRVAAGGPQQEGRTVTTRVGR